MRKIIQGLCAATATLIGAAGLSVALPTSAQAAPTCTSFTSVLSHHNTHGTIFAHVPSVGVSVDGVYGPQTRRWIDYAIFDHGNGGQLIFGLCQRVTV